jgi:uncharacterized membrane protein
MLYEVLKFLHITGVVMLLGNVTATAIWKFFADRSGNPVVIAFAQRLVTLTDISLTLWGIILMVVGGYGALLVAKVSPFEGAWLVYSQACFVVSGVIWLGVLVPLQIRQARAARTFADGSAVPASYLRDCRLWTIWGLISFAPLIAATWLMTAKPAMTMTL